MTQRFLRQNTPDVIAADEWASYPDLNPLDYCIWDILQDLVYEGRQLPVVSLMNLKEAIKNKWKEVTIETIETVFPLHNGTRNSAIADRPRDAGL